MLSTTRDEALSRANDVLRRHLAQSDEPRVLDAGCGRDTILEVGSAFVVGIDVDPLEIAENERLDERLVGDLQSHPLPQQSFDAAICWFVLEHLARPVEALDNMRGSLRDHGILFISVPDTKSLKTRLVAATPSWLHRRIWRWLWPRASGHGPFETVYDSGMTLEALQLYAERNRLSAQQIPYESRTQLRIRTKLHLTGLRWRALASAVSALTLRHVEPWNSDSLVIMQKQPSAVGEATGGVHR